MTLDKLLDSLNKRIHALKFEQEWEDIELAETLRIAGDSCYASGYSRGRLYAIRDELMFLKGVLSHET
jgi:hypothetical protein